MLLNTIGYLVVILLLVVVLVILTTQAGKEYDSTVMDNSGEAVSETTCQIRCNKCCNYEEGFYPGICGSTADTLFNTSACNCNC